MGSFGPLPSGSSHTGLGVPGDILEAWLMGTSGQCGSATVRSPCHGTATSAVSWTSASTCGVPIRYRMGVSQIAKRSIASSEHQIPMLRKQDDRGKRMRIVLLRHGKPAIAGRKGLSAFEFAEWLDEYDQAGLCSRSLPEQETMAIAAQCNSKWCSNLQRSICSIKTVCPDADFVVCKLFRELELSHGPWHWPKLNSTAWSVLFRLLGFCGFAYQAESWQQAKHRAQGLRSGWPTRPRPTSLFCWLGISS